MFNSVTVTGMFILYSPERPGLSLVVVRQLFKGGEFSHCFASSQVFPQLDKCGEWRDWELNITSREGGLIYNVCHLRSPHRNYDDVMTMDRISWSKP